MGIDEEQVYGSSMQVGQVVFVWRSYGQSVIMLLYHTGIFYTG